MKRYGYEQRDIKVRDGISYRCKRVPGYAIFDRIRGSTFPIGRADDIADAELIVSALNAFADTQAKPSNHNTLVLAEARAA